MAPVPAWARTVQQRLFREGRRDSRPSPRVAVAFLVGLLLLLTGSCSVSHASGAPADGTAHATPATPASAAPTAPGFTMVASGDVLPHSPLVARARAYGARSGRAYDFRPMFSAIKPIVAAADLAVCHVETPLSPTGKHLSGYPVFNGPPQVAAALRATGYDACSTASNHSLDQGPQGVSGTLQVLDSAGLRHAGIARNGQEGRVPVHRGLPALGAGVPDGADAAAAPDRQAAPRRPEHRPDPRAPRARGAAGAADQRQMGRVRHGQPAVSPVVRVLPRQHPGRGHRLRARRAPGRPVRGRRPSLRPDVGAAPRLHGPPGDPVARPRS